MPPSIELNIGFWIDDPASWLLLVFVTSYIVIRLVRRLLP